MKVSVIVTTYNWPQALRLVLQSLCSQSHADFEVIVADDGSEDQTAKLIQHYQRQNKISIRYCWQPDQGFRAAKIRNRAVAMARYDYLIFLDGDCVPRKNFIANHCKLAERGYFVSGSRVLLSQAFTQSVLSTKNEIHHYSLMRWLMLKWTRQCNRFFPLLTLPLGALRKRETMRWQGAKTCNLAMWRNDFLAVNGFDEQFIGWGFEDSDLVIRLQKNSVKRKSGKFFVPVIHCWHPEQSREKMLQNEQKLQSTLLSEQTFIEQGINQYFNHAFTTVKA